MEYNLNSNWLLRVVGDKVGDKKRNIIFGRF